MRQVFGVFLVSALLSSPAAAQTVLSLSGTGTVLAQPDEMVAGLTVQASAAGAAAAQADVNKVMAKALAAAKAVAGVVATTANYNVYQTTNDAGAVTGYQASQTLNLTIPAPGGVPPAAFTALVGRLQDDGLLLNALEGDLSPAGSQQAGAQAVTLAIQQVQAQAAAIAKTLGQRVGVMKSLNVNTDNAGPPMPMRMLAMAAKAPAPPQAAPGPVSVAASVSAEITLTP
jgi:uncharacterized protein YggE